MVESFRRQSIYALLSKHVVSSQGAGGFVPGLDFTGAPPLNLTGEHPSPTVTH